jgi:hypothetical protein
MNRLHTVGVWLSYAAIGLLTLELASRADDYLRHGASFWKPYSIDTIFEPSEFGLTGRPNARFMKWSLNSLGYRGPEPVPGRTNVLTFGASETFGLYETPDNEDPRQLERELNRSAPRFNVVNIAVPGMTIGKVDYFEHAIDQLAPRYVVVYPSPANYIGVTQPFCGRPTQPVVRGVALSDEVRMFGKTRELAKRVLPAKLMTALRRASTEIDARKLDVIARVPDETIDAFRHDVACITDAAKRHGVTVLLVTHPTFFGVDRQVPLTELDRQLLVAWRRFYPVLSEDGFLDLENRANVALRVVAAQAEVEIVDAAAEVPPGPKYFADFVHPTDLGSAMIATLIAAKISGGDGAGPMSNSDRMLAPG